MEYNDNTIMPFGVHKGKKLIEVPDEYLVWLYHNNKCSPVLKQYIEDNLYDKLKINKDDNRY